jgi:isoleucyl-tRNA synthetase
VQQARKDAGLHVSDRVRVAFEADDATAAAIAAHAGYVREQVLAIELTAGAAPAGAFAAEGKVGSGGGAAVKLAVAKV